MTKDYSGMTTFLKGGYDFKGHRNKPRTTSAGRRKA